MWKLNKPCIIKATNDDVRNLTSHCNALDHQDNSILIDLYRNYDLQGGKVTEAQLSTIENNKADAIYFQYKKTYKGETLNYIRTELNQSVDLCPYCSINQTSHLDHFMDRKTYKALAVCRLNLVPLCGVCNQKKHHDDYKDYIHAYYDDFPATEFLVADVQVLNSKFVVTFLFDSNAINNTILEAKLKYQTNKIELWNRLLKSTNNFLSNLFQKSLINDDEALGVWLSVRLKDYQYRYGLNDWRCAVIRGVLKCPDLNIGIVNSYKLNPHRLNGGAGA